MKNTPRMPKEVVSDFTFEFDDSDIRLFPSKFGRKYRASFVFSPDGTHCTIELFRPDRQPGRYSGGFCKNQDVTEPWPFYEIKAAFDSALVRSLYSLPIRRRAWKALRDAIRKYKEEKGYPGE